MASSNPPLIRSSRSTFKFEINYSMTKDLPMGLCVHSPAFTADGYDWAIEYYPRGHEPEYQVSASLFLILKSKAKDILALYSFGIHKNEVSIPLSEQVDRFTSSRKAQGRGRAKYIREELAANFIHTNFIRKIYGENGVFVISCDMTVFERRVVKNHPGGLGEHIEKLWKTAEGFDVTFEVQGQSISAHRLILAARSPVFRAKLFGSMAEAKMERMHIDEMKVEVFKALLHFIYMDELAIDESSDDEIVLVELLQGLFVAADLYALDKLFLLCEEQLASNLSVDTVVTTLLLADQHSCPGLKEKCLDFASDPKNFSLVALTEGYLHIMPGSPLLLAELSSKIKSSFVSE